MSLTFVTLDTGDLRRIERADSDDAAVRQAAAILRRALYRPAAPAATADMLRERGGEPYVQVLDLALSALHPAMLHPPPAMSAPAYPSEAEAAIYRAAVGAAPLSQWTLQASMVDGGSGLLATVYRPVLVPDRSRTAPAPVATFGVARDDWAGETLWRILHEQIVGRGSVATDPEQPPAAPWLGVRLEIGAALPRWDRQAYDLQALADVERLIAWAITEEMSAGGPSK